MNQQRNRVFGGQFGLLATAIAACGLAFAVTVSLAQESGDGEKKAEETKQAPEIQPEHAGGSKPQAAQPAPTGPKNAGPTLPATPQPQITPSRAAAGSVPTETPTGAVTGAPAIRIAEPKKDFGTQWAGPDLNHEFIIKNEGDQLLKILNVKPSCGCTVAGAYDKEITPGAQGKIPMQMKSEKLHDRFTKTVTVESNDPATPTVRLTLTGEIKQLIAMDPPRVSFSQITNDTMRTIPVKLTNNTSDPVKIQLTNPTSGCFTAELVETEAGKAWDLNITAKPPYEPKLNRANFTLTTDLSQMAQLTVPVSAFLPERLQIQPAQLTITSASPKEMSRRMVFINNGESPVKVLSASSDDKTLSFEVIEQEAGKRYDLVVNLPAGYNPPPSGKNIVLALDDSETPELKVPIVGRRTNTRDVTPEHVKSVYEGTGAKFALALDPTRQGNTHFKVASFPTLVLVGKDGTVEAVHAGAKQNLDTLLDEQIQKLLDGKNRDAFDAQPAAGGKPRPTEALVGQKAPQVTFTTTDGKEIKTGVATGKVQVLDFFASWCGYCKKQIPVVNSLYTSKYADNPNVEFVAVSEDTLVQADNTNGRVTIKGDAAGGIQLTPMSGPPPGFQQPQPTGAAAGGEGSK